MQSLKQRREEQRPIVVRGSQIAARIRARRSQACPPARTVCKEQARFARSRQRTRPRPHEAAASRISFIIMATSETSISPNSFRGRGPPTEITWGAAGFCKSSRAKCHFSGQDRLPARETSALRVESDVFYHAHWALFRASLNPPTLSMIRTCRALAPANGATRQRSAR